MLKIKIEIPTSQFTESIISDRGLRWNFYLFTKAIFSHISGIQNEETMLVQNDPTTPFHVIGCYNPFLHLRQWLDKPLVPAAAFGWIENALNRQLFVQTWQKQQVQARGRKKGEKKNSTVLISSLTCWSNHRFIHTPKWTGSKWRVAEVFDRHFHWIFCVFFS